MQVFGRVHWRRFSGNFQIFPEEERVFVRLGHALLVTPKDVVNNLEIFDSN